MSSAMTKPLNGRRCTVCNKPLRGRAVVVCSLACAQKRYHESHREQRLDYQRRYDANLSAEAKRRKALANKKRRASMSPAKLAREKRRDAERHRELRARRKAEGSLQ